MRCCIRADAKYIQTFKEKKLAGKKLIAQVAPSVRVALGEPFGGKVKGTQIVTSLKRIGFDYVFDTNFSADVTIVEEANELIQHIKNGQPMYTSCCPGWMQFVDSSCPEIKGYISTCKSPQQMMGALVKTYFAEKIHQKPEDIYMVSVMPCVKKQGESEQAGIDVFDGIKDVDLVVTTQDLADVLKVEGINPIEVEETQFDSPMGESSGGAAIFGRTGGVMLAALRYAYNKLTGKNLEGVPEWSAMDGLPGVKEAEINMTLINGEKLSVKVAVVVGLADAKKYVAMFKDKKVRHDFVEVMACFPHGCLGSSGQPQVGKNKALLDQRKAMINELDDGCGAHQNINLKELYDSFIGEPCGEKAHHLLHRSYDDH